MQRNHWIAILAAGLLLAACSGADGLPPPQASAVPPEPAVSASANAPTESAQPSVIASTTGQAAETDQPTEAVTEEATDEVFFAPGQRTSPLPVDGGFHNDEARVVGASGRPQFIEIFTFW